MAAVKGSKQHRMVVVPYRPWRIWWLGGAMLALLLLAGGGAWFLGQQQVLLGRGDAGADRDALLREVEGLRAENQRLQQQVLNLEQTSMVDKEALTSVQGTIVGLRGQISQLQEDVLFYKQVLSPENEDTGLVIGKLDLVQAEGAGSVRYKLELKQQGNNDNVVSGHVNVNVLGLQGGEEVSIPLHSLSDDVTEADIKLQFRYFQNVEGSLTLPPDFEPQKIQILAVARGDNPKTVQKSFGWLIQN